MSDSRAKGILGWQQFIASKHEMLARFDAARAKNYSHIVRTSHGNVAEAIFREFLAQFLPKRFGVASGYIISQGMTDTEKTPHYDVIIYDQLESPILWVDSNPDNTHAGVTRALPVEYVHCVIEVKSSLTRASLAASLEHLQELSPFLNRENDPETLYPYYAPNEFCCAWVCFELRRDSVGDHKILEIAWPELWLRKYIGGLVLRAEGLSPDKTGRLSINCCGRPNAGSFEQGMSSLTQHGLAWSPTVDLGDDLYLYTTLDWDEAYFCNFMFELLRRMQGTKVGPGVPPTMHGIVFPDFFSSP